MIDFHKKKINKLRFVNFLTSLIIYQKINKQLFYFNHEGGGNVQFYETGP